MSSALSSPPSSTPTLKAGRHPVAVALFVSITVLLLAADLSSKSLAFRHVGPAPVTLSGHPESDRVALFSIPAVVVVPSLLSLKLTLNTGAVFGLGSGAKWLFVAMSVLAVAVIGHFFFHSRPRQHLLHLSLACILAGALGNLFDRLCYNAVRDLFYLFPDVHLPLGLTWPGSGSRELYPWIFNLADVSLLVGVCLSLFILWRMDKPRPAA
ncbi:MAG: signal peptidase II [Phycisphaeraceae bacterium]|nr:signal peptidase II [Phycisphaeraceae bacterium]